MNERFVTVELPYRFASSMLSEMVERLKKLDTEISGLNAERSELLERIERIKVSMDNTLVENEITDGYQREWSIFRKIVFLLENSEHDLSTADMVQIILNKYEPHLKSERSKLVSSMSGVLSTKTKEGKIFRSLNILGEYVFSLRKKEAENQNSNTDDLPF